MEKTKKTVFTMAPKRSRRRIRSDDTVMVTESSSASESEKKPTKNSQRRSTRLKTKKGVDSSTSIDSAYDGDGETTCSANEMTPSSNSDQSMSSPSSDMYDFDEDDGVPSRGILSPKQPKVKKKSSKRKTNPGKEKNSSSKSRKPRKCSPKTDTPSGTPVITKGKSNSENKPVRKPKGMKTPGVSPILSCSTSRLDSSIDISLDKRGKRKIPGSTPSVTPCVTTKSKTPRIDAIKNDSGIFVSPPPQKIPRLVAKDTSTPSNVKDDVQRGINDKCFGFDALGSPARVTTSDYGSAVMDISQISMDDAMPSRKDFEVTMFSEPESVPDPEPDISLNKSITSAYKPTKQKRPKGRYSITKMDAWADKMNQEFSDAENFELSIEG